MDTAGAAKVKAAMLDGGRSAPGTHSGRVPADGDPPALIRADRTRTHVR
ncbi:hypothetical protein ACWGJX_06460 [Streptomyces sp. NPDC054775]